MPRMTYAQLGAECAPPPPLLWIVALFTPVKVSKLCIHQLAATLLKIIPIK